MRMEISSKLRVLSTSYEYVKSINDTLHPDNKTAPPHLTINDGVIAHNDRYEYFMELKTRCGVKCFDSIRGTLDEVLTILSSIEKIMDTLK